MNDKGYTLTTSIELWKRWFDWRGNPWLNDASQMKCFFCDGQRPNHDVNCVYLIAKELVSLDEKGELA